MDVGAQTSAYVNKWTSTNSILRSHSKVSCPSWSIRTLEQPQGCSILLFLGINITLKCANTNTVHCYTCGWAEAELAPLQKPFI